MKFKTIGYRFERNSLHEVGRVASKPGVAKAIDHTTGVAPEVEPAGLLANRLVRAAVLLWHGLEPLSEDYALATLVWSQQTAYAEQIRAITKGVIKETTRTKFVWFFYGSE